MQKKTPTKRVWLLGREDSKSNANEIYFKAKREDEVISINNEEFQKPNICLLRRS
jgi:hypothetical protein